MRRIAITTLAATLALGIAMGATAASQATSSKGAAANIQEPTPNLQRRSKDQIKKERWNRECVVSLN